jgi:hypothetical protein
MHDVLPSTALTLRLPPVRRFLMSVDALVLEALFEGREKLDGAR